MSKLSNELATAIMDEGSTGTVAQGLVAHAFKKDGKIDATAKDEKGNVIGRFGDLTTVEVDGKLHVTAKTIMDAHNTIKARTDLDESHPDYRTTDQYGDDKRNLNNRLRRAAKALGDMSAFQVGGKVKTGYFVHIKHEAEKPETTFDSDLRKLINRYVEDGQSLPALETIAGLVFADLNSVEESDEDEAIAA